MEEINRKQKANDLFMQGYSCAQSVVAAFQDVLPLSEQELLNVSAPFGAGFARSRNVCGAVAAMGLVYGLYNSTKSINPEDKGAIYEAVGKMTEDFKLKNGSIICAELLQNVKILTQGYVPDVRNAEYYKARPCLKFVLDAVDIIEKGIINK